MAHKEMGSLKGGMFKSHLLNFHLLLGEEMKYMCLYKIKRFHYLYLQAFLMGDVQNWIIRNVELLEDYCGCKNHFFEIGFNSVCICYTRDFDTTISIFSFIFPHILLKIVRFISKEFVNIIGN